MRLVGAMVDGYRKMVMPLDSPRAPVRPVERDLSLVVDEVRTEAEGVRSLRLVSPHGDRLPGWQPGAHLDVLLPSGRLRQYSLCGDFEDGESYRIAVRRLPDGGGGSEEIHRDLAPGSPVKARGPRNAFPFVRANTYLFVAGGIGITPILPMVRAAAGAGADWRFVYCGRTRESMPFGEEMRELDPSRVWIRPDTEYGVPAAGSEILESAPRGAQVYCCGPQRLINALRVDFGASDASGLHFERFAAPPIVDGKPFEIELARSERILSVPADRSALDVIREAEPGVAYSCKQGFCGTCRVGLLSGNVRHRDKVLTEEERHRNMMICVSRAEHGRIVLDL